MSHSDVDLKKANNIRDLGMTSLVFVVFVMALAGAVRVQIVPVPYAEYLYGIAWMQWAGVVMVGAILIVMIQQQLKTRKLDKLREKKRLEKL